MLPGYLRLPQATRRDVAQKVLTLRSFCPDVGVLGFSFSAGVKVVPWRQDFRSNIKHGPGIKLETAPSSLNSTKS